MKKTIIATSLIIFGLLLTNFLSSLKTENIANAQSYFIQPGGCTADVKQCPDSSIFVSRTGPNCEFSPCPGEPGYNVPTPSLTSTPTPTPSSTVSPRTPGLNPLIKICSSDSDCTSNQYCYQPPMPQCTTGASCPQVMPAKYCKQKPLSLPTATIQPVEERQPITRESSPQPVAIRRSDFNRDSKIDLSDVMILRQHLLKRDSSDADLNGDGKVNLLDFAILMRDFRR